MLAALHDSAVSQHDRRRDEVIAGQAVPPADEPEAAAEGEPGDADARRGSGGDGEVMLEVGARGQTQALTLCPLPSVRS